MRYSSLPPSRIRKLSQSLLWSIKQQQVLYKQMGDVEKTLWLG
jgi:hypothetical protein